jgi:competence protein ComEC
MRAGRVSRLAFVGAAAVVALALAHRVEIRERAEAALGQGMPPREAKLARGFVLGEDEEIDEATVEDFRRAGLSHLLAVSGQNVALLALLAMPLLAALGMPLRTRLVWLLGAIVVYVPLAGAGPSILRAGVMGGLTVLATLVGRRASRLYGLAVAAIVTLAIDPHIAADVGWQLSFAAVLGIVALASPIRRSIVARIGRAGWRSALAEGAAMTVSATLATAPLVAFHFEAVSTTTLVANLLALPAVAPAMWLGMLAAAGGQVPGFPVELLNTVEAPLLAYIAQVAAWCGRPGWAYVHVRLGLPGLFVSYAAITGVALAMPQFLRRRRLFTLRRRVFPSHPGRNAFSMKWMEKALRPGRGMVSWIAAGVGVGLLCLAWASGGGGDASADLPGSGLRVEVLDVAQGDAILFQPARAPAVLVDGGPPGDGLARLLHEAGVDGLGVAVVTHEQSDHAGGVEELLGRFPIERLAYARLSRRLRGEAEAVGALPQRLAAGGAIRSGALRMEVLWPPQALLSVPLGGTDPNTQALVLLARWRRFSMLLTADAEAGDVPLDPGPIDVLKVAHHGSEDTGLSALLDATAPGLAVISVGADNPYGHPTPPTLAELASHHVPTLRTDQDGTITLEVGRRSVEVGTDR